MKKLKQLQPGDEPRLVVAENLKRVAKNLKDPKTDYKQTVEFLQEVVYVLILLEANKELEKPITRAEFKTYIPTPRSNARG